MHELVTISHEWKSCQSMEILSRVIALYTKQNLLLACDKPTFELPAIHDRRQLHSRELESWVCLVTPTVKSALADAAQYLRHINRTILDFLAPARPDPLTIDELVNELRPIPRMPNHRSNPKQIYFSSRFAFCSRQLCACCSYESISGV